MVSGGTFLRLPNSLPFYYTKTTGTIVVVFFIVFQSNYFFLLFGQFLHV